MSAAVEIPVVQAPDTVHADSEALSQTRSTTLNWIFVVTLTVFHIGAIAALFFFSWSALAVFAVLWILGQNVGIAMCYHRLLTHRGFITPKWVEYAMAVCSTLSLQGGPIYWVAVHRMHHQLRTGQAIRTPPATASGGRIWAGSSRLAAQSQSAAGAIRSGSGA